MSRDESLPDSAQLDAWRKAAAKSAPGGDVEALNWRTPEGLVAAWFGGTEEGHDDVGIWLSRHVGGAWTTPREVARDEDIRESANAERVADFLCGVLEETVGRRFGTPLPLPVVVQVESARQRLRAAARAQVVLLDWLLCLIYFLLFHLSFI